MKNKKYKNRLKDHSVREKLLRDSSIRLPRVPLLMQTGKVFSETIREDQASITEVGFQYVMNNPDVPEQVRKHITSLWRMYHVSLDIEETFKVADAIKVE